MSLSAKRTCPVCQLKFDPIVEWQVCDTQKCATVLRVRRFRARKRFGGDDDGGGGKQRRLFPKPMLAKGKPPRPTPVVEPTLFEGDLLATIGGSVEYREGEDSPRPIRNIPGIMLTRRKPSRGVLEAGEPHAA